MPPDDNDLTDAAKAEIAAAIKIIKEDFWAKHFPEPSNPSNDPKKDDPKAPPVKDDGEPTPKKKGLWWGDALNS